MRRALAIPLGAFAVAALGSWAITAAAHVEDGYGVNHVAGTWLELARSAADGTLYPPLYDGEAFGGTRYMPVPILLHGGLGLLLDDYLVAGKLLSFTLLAALLVLLVVVLRARDCPIVVAGALAALVVVTNAGLTAGTGIGHDTLPVILQLAAVALVAETVTARRLLVAAALCAIALAAKLSAVWAALAICLWLLIRGPRRRLPPFAAAYGGLAALLLGVFELASGGRMSDNVLGLGISTSRGFESLAWEQSRLRYIFGDGLGAVRLLLILALVAVAVAAWRRRATLFDLSLVVASAVLAVVLADRGTFSNQLLDVLVLSAVVVGSAWVRLSTALRVALVVAVLAIGIAGLVQHADPVAGIEALGSADGERLPAIAQRLDPEAPLLSENPYVPFALGQRPVVLDAFMLWTIARRHPDWRDDLVRRLDARAFGAVVLFYRPEDRRRSEAVRFWFETEHFGPEIVDAIERNYRADARVGGLWLYRPRAAGS